MGYIGYSMSENAFNSYICGEKPRSKWTKTGLIDEVEQADVCPTEKLDILKKLSKKILLDTFLIYSGWHHTSSHYNQTDFYAVDFEKIEEISLEELTEMLEITEAEPIAKAKKYRASVKWLEWSDTRRHPKATEHSFENILVEEKGCFYTFFLPNGANVRKKIGSNGTKVIKEGA